MSQFSRAPVTAVLGPTNTGKTHLAVERFCAHSSGMMGFPLRLLAREIYDRVVALKGPKEAALITGEEKIEPPGARWYLCTAESMPLDKDFSFVALDEAQLGTDPERGHIFTDRMLRARGRDETMILGSAALSGMVRSLLPEAEIISRPRFSTLSYAGAKKLSRLPKRSAIVAFSGGSLLALEFSGVVSLVQGHGKVAGLGAGLFNAPHLHIPNGAPDGLPVQLGLKHERLGPGGGHTHPKAGHLCVTHECLGLVRRAGQALNYPGGQVHGLGQIGGFGVFWACHQKVVRWSGLFFM